MTIIYERVFKMKTTNYTITADKFVKGRYTIKFTKPNKNGETMIAEISTCSHDLNNKNSLMNLWVKNGWLKKPLKSFWSIDTSVYGNEGCYRKYDPSIIAYQQINRKNNKVLQNRHIINFDYILEATADNMQLLIDEIEKRFYNMAPTKQRIDYI